MDWTGLSEGVGATTGFGAKAGPGLGQGWAGSERGSLTSFLTFLSCFLQHLQALADYFFQAYVLYFEEKPKTRTRPVKWTPKVDLHSSHVGEGRDHPLKGGHRVLWCSPRNRKEMQAEPRAPQLTENVFAQALKLGVLEHVLVQFRCPDKEKYSQSRHSHGIPIVYQALGYASVSCDPPGLAHGKAQ